MKMIMIQDGPLPTGADKPLRITGDAFKVQVGNRHKHCPRLRQAPSCGACVSASWAPLGFRSEQRSRRRLVGSASRELPHGRRRAEEERREEGALEGLAACSRRCQLCAVQHRGP